MRTYERRLRKEAATYEGPSIEKYTCNGSIGKTNMEQVQLKEHLNIEERSSKFSNVGE